MKQYQIIVTPDAVDDMVELRNYIADVLCAPNTALSYIRAVRKEIAALSEMPARYRPVDDEPWHSRGIRKFLVKNSFVYNEKNKRLFYKQKRILDLFQERGAISKAQHDKSLRDLKEKMQLG